MILSSQYTSRFIRLVYKTTYVMRLGIYLFALLLLVNTNLAFADKAETTTAEEIDLAAMELAFKAFADSLEATFKYETGVIELGNGRAELVPPDGFKYLNAKDARRVLVDIWGNPPFDDEEGVYALGMLMPDEFTVTADKTYAIEMTFLEDGYIKDDDAKDIDYDDLLNEMKSDAKAANEQRKAMGYPTVEMIGWASAPFYDEVHKKLHWAKELKFEGEEMNTLNYNIRMLGRKGFLQLNVIGGMDILPEVKENINPILNSVNFNEGHQYADFDPKLDKVAAYGIGGLIAGKVLAKTGLIAKAGILLAKFWKVIALAFIAFGASIRKLFTGK